MLLFYITKTSNIKEQVHTTLWSVSSWTVGTSQHLFFVGCRYNDWPAVSVPNIPLDNVSVCFSLIVSSGLQSSKESVFPVTVLWQKHLHTVTHSDQPNQLSAGKNYTEYLWSSRTHLWNSSHVDQACCHTKIVFLFFQAECSCMFFLIYVCMALSRILSSVLVWEMLICECWVVQWENPY